ncbi:MAG: TrmB family transcriptional regulator [Candidatus Heimdallarchaeota archaeon]
MTDRNVAINALVSLGLSLGESKVYTALYTYDNLEATPLAKIAEVPQSKVYSYLSSLEKRGIVSKIAIEGKPNLYSAISYEQVISQLQDELNSKVDIVEDYFKTVSHVQPSNELPDFIRVMQGDLAVRNGLGEIINSLERNIVIIPNDYYIDLVNRLIDKRDKYESIEITNYGKFINNIHANIPIDSPFKSKFDVLMKKARPFILFTDVDFESFSAKSANFILPPVDGIDPVLIQFRHPLIVNIQFGMISSIFDLMNSTHFN